MALPTGLIPIFVFLLTVGISLPVALGANVFYRNGNGSFESALRAALLEAGGFYLIGVLVVWSIAGGIEVWEIAATLLVTGVGALLVLVALPLIVGQWLIQRVKGGDAETALRATTYGWPIGMLAVFGIFVAPGGLAHGHLLDLGGPQICLAGFCGISVSFAAGVLLEAVVAVLGPGIVGVVLYDASTARQRARP